MKLRQKVEDFQVSELNSFEISNNGGEYKLHLLEKSGLETFFIFKHIAQQNKIPISEFGVAGLKDKHAVTKQYFTIPSKYEIKALREQNFSITFLGYVKKQLGIGDLKGNEFRITVRNIRKEDLGRIKENSSDLQKSGIPNYFGSQRFGSVVRKNFIVKFVMKKDYEQAVRLFLTEYTKHENRKRKEEKRKIAEHWNELKELKTENRLFSNILEEYKKTNSWLSAYKKIPHNLREMFVSAYQSYLWNESVKMAFTETIDKRKIHSVEYALGTLFFYKNTNEDELKKLPEKFKMFTYNTHLSEFENKIVTELLSKENITLKDFDIQKQTGTFFKVYDRELLLKPKNFMASQPEIDEMNDSEKSRKLKITFSFVLPKGSYATIIIQKIFT